MTSTPIPPGDVELLDLALDELEEAGAELDAHLPQDAHLAGPGEGPGEGRLIRPAGRVVQAIAATLSAGRVVIRATKGEE